MEKHSDHSSSHHEPQHPSSSHHEPQRHFDTGAYHPGEITAPPVPSTSEEGVNVIYTCPICGVAVFTITDNILSYRQDHVVAPKNVTDPTSVTIEAYHPGEFGRPN